VQDSIDSFVRLSAAMSAYSMQRRTVDSMTDALTAQRDASKKQTVENISSLSADVVGRTFDTLNASRLNPLDLVQAKAVGEVLASH